MLQVARFPDEGSKNSMHVSFPTILPADSFGSTTAEQYKLCSVIVHSGQTARSGHYYAFVRQGDSIWLRANDTEVTEVQWPVVAAAEAYILMYERVPVAAQAVCAENPSTTASQPYVQAVLGACSHPNPVAAAGYAQGCFDTHELRAAPSKVCFDGAAGVKSSSMQQQQLQQQEQVQQKQRQGQHKQQHLPPQKHQQHLQQQEQLQQQQAQPVQLRTLLPAVLAPADFQRLSAQYDVILPMSHLGPAVLSQDAPQPTCDMMDEGVPMASQKCKSGMLFPMFAAQLSFIST